MKLENEESYLKMLYKKENRKNLIVFEKKNNA